MGPIKRIQIEPDCLADAEGPFEDAAPAIAELQRMGIEVVSSDNTVANPRETLYITSSREGILEAKARGLHAILLMSDPDEAMKLTKLEPAGGIVSLLELPDFIRFLEAQPVGVNS